MKKSWILSLVFVALVTCSFAGENSSTIQAAIQDGLTLRRIAEYWKEGDIPAAKLQIREFLSAHQDGPHSEQLYMMLGDINFHEKNYAEALIAYEHLTDKESQEKTHYHRLHCLYQLGRYADTITSTKAFLKEGTYSKEQENTARFEMADSYYRLGRQTESHTAKNALFKEALNHYQVLMQTGYAEKALYPLAEVYTYFEEAEKAAEIFLKLASKYPEKRDEFLFQAATFQCKYNKQQAIETYEKVYRLNGRYAEEAAYNQLSLLFQSKLYRDLLLVHEEALKHIPSEQMPLMHYYIGKSLFAMGDYSQAIIPLKLFVASPVTDPSYVKNALLSLVACAKQINDLSLLEHILVHLKNTYPQDEETAKALLLHAQLCRDKGHLQRAKEGLKEVAVTFPSHPQREAILYDHAVLLSQCQEWGEATRAFRVFLQTYPNSLKKGAAWRHLAFCEIEETKQATLPIQKLKKQELVDTLSQALQQNKVFTQTEEEQVHFLLGKTYYEISNYDEALHWLAEYVDAHPKTSSSGEAHLLMAHCHLKGTEDLHLFVVEAEKALAARNDLTEQNSLHIQLYNAYLALAAQEGGKDGLIEQAADHLFSALDYPMKKENQLWLANHYYQKLQRASRETGELDFNRAVAVLEKLIGLSLEIPANSLEMEGEAIKLSQLYKQAHRYRDQARLLEQLQKNYTKHSDWDWKYQRLALFELAKSYEQLKDVEKAFETYDYLIQSAPYSCSYFTAAAQLNKIQLQYALLSEVKSNPKTVQPILDQLKDLEIKRKLVTEPVHLEAALNYIAIKTSLFSEEEQTKHLLTLVQQARERFTNLEDPLVKNYFSTQKQFRDKMRLFQQYMQYFSAEELRLQGMIALKNDETFRAKEYKMKALAELDSLLQEKVDDALQERILKSREALNQDL